MASSRSIRPPPRPFWLSRCNAISDQITLADWLDKKQKVDDHLHALTDAAGVPMLVGTLFYDHRPDGFSKYNSAILFEPLVKTIRTYNKIHLVPFGEFIPFLDALPWLTVFTPYRNGYVPTLNFGHEPLVFRSGPTGWPSPSASRTRCRTWSAGSSTRPPTARQPDMLINLSNDGWFHGSAELDMHLAVSVFRTIEHRVPLARAVNTGISALIDGNGEIRDTLPRQTESVLTVDSTARRPDQPLHRAAATGWASRAWP